MAARLLRFAAGFALALLAACTTVGPDYRRAPGAAINKASATGSFRNGSGPEFSDAPVPGDWWRLYDSAVLDRLITEALAANTDLRAAAANIARAHAGLSYANANAGPSTGVTAGVARGRSSAEEVGRPGKALPDTSTHSLGLSVSYQVDLFGQISRTIESAQ
ncbi:MAG: TolC family protein, partial [Ramlibacter sp.]|nr:TolC family protein [Ramlibacter sp.]